MADCFKRLRGSASGRVVPTLATPIDGTHVFILGAEGAVEPAVLREDDYVSVSQDVDLTGIDLVGASLETLGVATGAWRTVMGMTYDASTVALWTMDTNWVHAENAQAPGVNLLGEGDLAVASEDYSGEGSLCREVPVGSVSARLAGTNDPRLFMAPITAYTLDLWLRFNADAVADSDGWSPYVFDFGEMGKRIRLLLAGEGGPGPQHRWWPTLVHQNGGSSSSVIFTGYPITATVGWRMLSIVYDSTLVGAARCKLYVNGTFATDGASTMTTTPGLPTTAAYVRVADPGLWGRIDQVRVSKVARSAGDVLSQHMLSTWAPLETPAAWRMKLLVDGDIYCSRTIAAAERRTWADFFAPVRHLSGVHSVEFRLQIEEA